METTLIPVILSGGAGTRLWPLSRELYPKQLLALTGTQTMLQETAARLAGIEGARDPIVVCNEAHRFTVAEQLRTLGVNPSAILLEPVGRNTAPAVALAALQALRIDPEAILVVAPADHVVRDVHPFRQAAATAAALGVLTPMPCIPNTPAPWIPGAPTVLLGNMPTLDNTCQLMCLWAGVITFSDAGQETVMVP